MNSYDFFIYEFICFMNLYMNSGVPRFQMLFCPNAGPTGLSLTLAYSTFTAARGSNSGESRFCSVSPINYAAAMD